jgi:nucleoside-diphosphate-sugar epimerase
MTSNVDRAFVTGCAGMIGSNTARQLLAEGIEVVGVDNLWRGRLENFADLMAHPKFTFRHADIAADQDWHRDMRPSDALVHIADIVAGIGYVFANEWSVFQKNLLINTAVARVVNVAQPARFIYLGTACSYPQGLQRSVAGSVLSEAAKFPADPESGYGWSKLAGEIEFRLATKDTRTRFTVLDLHNVYGWPCVYRGPTAQVIPSLINRAMHSTDRKLTVWGNGKQGRAFLHVRDVVSAIVLALRYQGDAPTFMIGPDSCTTIAEVAELIRAHPRMRIDEIVFDVSRPTGDIGRYADASLAGRELGWKISVDFRSGLHELIDRILDDE